MIVRMKKLRVLLYYQERQQFLEALQDEGFVHIVEQDHRDAHHLHELATEIKETERVLREFALLKHGPAGAADPQPDADLLPVVAEFLKLKHVHESLAGELKGIEQDERQLRLCGGVDPACIRKIAAAGLPVRFYEADLNEWERLLQNGLFLVAAARIKHRVFFAVIGAALPVETTAQELHLPECSLSELAAKKAELKEQLARIDAKLVSFVACRDSLQQFLLRKRDELAFHSAGLDFSLFIEGKVLAMSGFFPAAHEERLRRMLARFTLWCSIEDPGLEEEVPVQLQNSAFARLFEPITRLYMLPHYRDLDPTPILAPFFTLFVGLCLGDVAYGLVIVLLSLGAYWRVPEDKKSYTVMGVILGGMTVVCGLMLNSCFGEPLFAGPGIPRETALFPGGGQYCLLSPYKNAEGITEFPAMSFSLLVGFVQILVAMAVQMFVQVRQGGFLNGCKPLSSIMMFFGMLIWGAHSNAFDLNIGSFAVGNWHLGEVLLAAPLWSGRALLLGGLITLLLGANSEKKFYIRPLLGIWDLYQFATGLLGDMLSYIRLFALGLCSGLLGSTFNSLALGFIRQDDGVRNLFPWILATVLLLAGGHCLNFALSLVGAFVHPIRLTFVEFFKNLNFTWGGKPFLPFCRISAKTKT